MEAVLSGVSAGVIGLDRHDRITLASRSAREAARARGDRSRRPPAGRGRPAVRRHRCDEAEEHKGRPQRQVTLIIDGEERNFSVRVTHEEQGEEDYGSVITFDDVTELVSAQRTSAWADVARRIAHEIKNPLTPIQLSAERLRRKYGRVIMEDREIFERCTDTIIRQVGDVTRMVDEFSAFARMPQAADGGPRHPRRGARRRARPADGQRRYRLRDKRLGSEPIIVSCDRRLIAQAISNLVKNAEEAIQQLGARAPDKEPGWRGRIETVVRRNGNRVEIEVIDNGAGLPKQNRNAPARALRHDQGQTRAPASASPSCRRASSSTAARLALEDAPAGPGRSARRADPHYAAGEQDAAQNRHRAKNLQPAAANSGA